MASCTDGSKLHVHEKETEGGSVAAAPIAAVIAASAGGGSVCQLTVDIRKRMLARRTGRNDGLSSSESM